jgi:hypothetical protein
MMNPALNTQGVSIQVVSPASGEFDEGVENGYIILSGFHSSSFPSEWGVSAQRQNLENLYRSGSCPFK